MYLETSDIDVALAFLHAWTSSDEVAARALCHDDLVFQGPIARREGSDVHVKALIGVAQEVRGLEVRRTVASGSDIFVVYDLLMSNGESTSIAELHVVEDGLLVEIAAFFDTFALRGGS